MSSPRQSLATRVPWSKLTSELEIHVRTVGLPAAIPSLQQLSGKLALAAALLCFLLGIIFRTRR